ncbi:MAG TPA: hypothetical protein VE991_14940 [Acidimicrobiales bacterium]|nr:hypothetical protein [Acidimicrobiales bacterium]
MRRTGGTALLTLSVLLNVTEASISLAVLPRADTVLALQASALAPFAVFHDLRWLSVFSASWPGFALELTAIVVGRGALTAVSVRLAWPTDATRPVAGTAPMLARTVSTTAVAVLLLTPSTILLFAMAVVPISWLFIAAVPLAVGVAVLLSPLPVVGDSWRRLIPLQVIGWVLLSFLVFTVGALLLAHMPAWACIPVAALAGVFNAMAWTGTVRSLVLRDPSHLVLPVVPVAVVALALGVILGSVSGFVHARPAPLAGGVRPPDVGSGAQPVLVLNGYGSTWGGAPQHPIPGPFAEVRFSYGGVAADGAPLPYSSAATVRPLGELVRMLSVQVDHLAATSHRRVDLVGESEGAELAETYVRTDPRAPVDRVVLLSPLVAPARVDYPLRGPGSGFPARTALELLSGAYRSVSPVDLDPGSAFVASLDERSVVGKVLACPAAALHQFAVLPLADATASVPDAQLGMPYVVVPAFHGGLLHDPAVQRKVAGALEGRLPAGNALLGLAEHLVTDASAAWHVPLRDDIGWSCTGVS